MGPADSLLNPCHPWHLSASPLVPPPQDLQLIHHSPGRKATTSTVWSTHSCPSGPSSDPRPSRHKSGYTLQDEDLPTLVLGGGRPVLRPPFVSSWGPEGLGYGARPSHSNCGKGHFYFQSWFCWRNFPPASSRVQRQRAGIEDLYSLPPTNPTEPLVWTFSEVRNARCPHF